MDSDCCEETEPEDEEDQAKWRQPVVFESFESAAFKPEQIYAVRPRGGCSEVTPSCEVRTNAPPRSEVTSPFKREDRAEHHRCVIHIDFDCFYCQVEAIRNPVLKGKPFGVYQKHVVVSSNYVARRLGVKKMSTRAEALKICPEMIMVNGEDLTVYREFSMKMFNILKMFSSVVEKVGLDENFVDVTKNIDKMVMDFQGSYIVKGHCYGHEGKTDMVRQG